MFSAIAAATAMAFSSSVIAANNVNGQIVDAKKGIALSGALIQIPELNVKISTGKDGRFRFDNLPAGTYNIQVSYLGAAPQVVQISISDDRSITQDFAMLPNQSSVDEVLVIGQRASQANALNRQKNSNRITSIVSAGAIGQYPDQNAAEALQRLPGMFIQRDQGEGRFVGIRGIDPSLNNLTINGLNVPSPEAGIRSVAMDVIPSELISSLEVSKTVTPDMDADAIGGSIEVKSITAFERSDKAFSIAGQLGYNEQQEENSPKLSASYSRIFPLNNDNKLGVAGAVSWAERKFGSENIETDGGWGDIELENINTGADEEFFGAAEIEQRAYKITRERTGVAVNIDLQTTSADYYIRSLYSKFSDDEYRLRNEYKFEDGDLQAFTSNSLSTVGAEMDRDTKDRYEEQTIFSTVFGAEHQLRKWTLEYSVGYSKSEEAEPDRLDVDFKGEGFDLGYTSTGPLVEFTQSNDAHNLSNFELDEFVFENNFTEDEETSFKLDLSRQLNFENASADIKFGGKIRQREKFNNASVQIFDGGFDDVTAAQFEAANPQWDLGNFGPSISRAGIRSFFKQNRNQLELNTLDSNLESQGASFESAEDITALYAMTDVSFDKWQIIAGLRYESTDFETLGNRVELVEDEVNDIEDVLISEWAVKNDYDHLLPNLSLRYDHNDKLLFRFAYTNTIARPAFGDSAAFQIIESKTEEDDGEIVVERQAEVGNPSLETYESMNLDFSIEYYPGQIGVMSAGLFYKDIDNFVEFAEVQDNGMWDGFDEVIQAINGGSAELSGLELAYTTTFDVGLLLVANATFTDSDVNLPNQADTVANFAIGYESNTISTRLTFAHRSESYQFLDQGRTVYEDSHNQIDFNLKYFINDQVNVYFNAVNLNDEPLYLYHEDERLNYQYETYGRTFELGFSWNAF